MPSHGLRNIYNNTNEALPPPAGGFGDQGKIFYNNKTSTRLIKKKYEISFIKITIIITATNITWDWQFRNY